MKKILITIALLVTSVTYANNTPMTDLAATNKPVYVRINRDIAPASQQSTLQWEKSKGGFFSADKYTLRLTFYFKRQGPYGAKDGSGSQFLPIKKGTIVKMSKAEINPSGYKSSDAFYLSAEGPEVKLGDGQSTRDAIYIQILGNNKDSISKLSISDLEEIFENAITFSNN